MNDIYGKGGKVLPALLHLLLVLIRARCHVRALGFRRAPSREKKCGGIARKNPVRYIATRTPFGFGNMTYFEEFPADSYKYFEGFPADAYYKYFEKFPADSCKSFAEFTADSP